MSNKICFILCSCLLLSACASNLDSPYSDLKQHLQNSPAKIVPASHDTKVILPVVDTINTANTKLRPSIFPTLNSVVQVMKEYPETYVDIIGYTDNVGHERGNIIVSEKRAKIVAAFLIAHHISLHRVHTHGRGPADPMASNDTATGRALNRRVEIVFYSKSDDDS